ncbi:PREDICTED: uncharacterized protein LOC109335439 [Lupinus angustifolius]|uniref:uncharacterized protein LOC109335439 n=1 Tax=Lupinus angustifolius TaxID=3871 RepID=UPI00092E3FAF|nr:PREDICTED: uncharacterized protein LOC109335439 [Lupinus angustifolius]
MEEQERVYEYFTRIRSLINLMRSCGEQISEQGIVEKILRTLLAKFDHVVVAIEESKDLEHFKIGELHGSLEAHEQIFLERLNDRQSQQALSVQFQKRNSGHNNKSRRDECKLKRRCKDVEARLAKDEDSDEEVLLMAEKEISGLEGSDSDEALLMITAKNDQHPPTDNWYLDTGCSNHMTGHKEWFLTLDDSVRNKVKFADNSFITAEGIGKIMIKKKDGTASYISNVMYVPKMKNNLISLGQLLEKGYNMRMEDRMLKIFNKNRTIILKAPLSTNRTFKIGIQLEDHECLESIADETWI